jgi:hypothetical protein
MTLTLSQEQHYLKYKNRKQLKLWRICWQRKRDSGSADVGKKDTWKNNGGIYHPVVEEKS